MTGGPPSPTTGKGRNELIPAISGTETDPRQTIRRLEEAFLKQDAAERTAKSTEDMKNDTAAIRKMLEGMDIGAKVGAGQAPKSD